MTSACHVSGLLTYPVKSLGGISKDECYIDDFGFAYDRRFMLIDDNNKFVTQRTHPKLALLVVNEVLASDGSLSAFEISSEQAPFPRIIFPMSLYEEKAAYVCQVVVWGDSVSAKVLDSTHTKNISEFLGLNVCLAFMPTSSFRQVDRQFFSEDKRVSFADGYPFLLTSEVSLADLNARLEHPVSMKNFRPNIIISNGISAYAEDDWKRITIGDITFELVKPCSRCVMTTVTESGEKSESREPLKTLSQYRKNEFGICFGQNLVHLSNGVIRVGDLVSFE